MKTENPTTRRQTAAVGGPSSAENAPTTLLSMRNGAVVWGSDGELGPLLAIVVDPTSKTATEIAVRNGDVPDTGRMVKVGDMVSASPDRIDVGLSHGEFFALDRFIVPYRSVVDHAGDASPDSAAWSDMWLLRPGTFLFAVHENVPSGDVAIHRGMHVFNASGHRAGSVEAWNFHPETGRLASLLFTAHTLLHRHCLLIDASSVASIDQDGVRLTLSAAELDALEPTRP